MTEKFTVVEVFELTGRGAVAVLNEPTGRDVGRAHRVQLLKPSGEIVTTQASKEWLLRRATPTPVEDEAFMLKGMRKDDVTPGTLIQFLDRPDVAR